MSSPQTSSARRRLLLVDDEPALLKMFEHALSKQGFEVDAVESPAAAQSMLALRRYDGVVTDKNMPEMDGVALAQWIRAMHPSMPIAMVTGYATPDAATSILRVVDVLMTKPVPIKALAAGVEKAIAMRSLGQTGDTHPVVIATPDAQHAFRIARMVRDAGAHPEAITTLDELARFPTMAGLLVDARCLAGEGTRSIWRALGRHEGLKLVLLTSSNDPDAAAKAVGLGATAHVSLASDEATLARVVRESLTRRALKVA